MEQKNETVQGFNESVVSKKNKKALQSETWEQVRNAKEDVKHFKAGEQSVENSYGATYHDVVTRFLKAGFKEEKSEHVVIAFGKKYKILKREKITVFYDADGNTLFDVENERLSQEYEWMNNQPVTKNEEVFVPMGTASLTDIVTGNIPAPTGEEISEAIEQTSEKEENLSVENNEDGITEDNKSSEEETPKEESAGVPVKPDKEVKKATKESTVYIGVVGAVTKLQKELSNAKPKEFAEPIIEYLIERCKESESLAADICQDHKTWDKCYKYIFKTAERELKGISGPVRSDHVFEWAEDYYHKDDKAEEEKKAKEAAEKKKKEAKKKKEKAKTTKENKARADYDTTRKSPTDNHKLNKEEIAAMDKKEALKPKPQSKKNNKDMDGQMDLFSLMGM